MTTNTEQNINEAIDWLQKTGSAVQDFAVEQAPLYCRELIKMEVLKGSIVLFAALLAIAFAQAMFAKARRLKADAKSEWSDDSSVVATFAWIITGFAIAALVVGGFVTARPLVAPRVVLIEKLMGLRSN